MPFFRGTEDQCGELGFGGECRQAVTSLRCGNERHSIGPSRFVTAYSAVNWNLPNTNCYFLVSEQESNQRSRHRGGIESIAPAIEAIRPYVPHPARTWFLHSTLTIEKRQGVLPC